MNVRAQADPRDIRELNQLFKHVELLGINAVEKLIDQTIIHAAASAANATKPRKGRDQRGNLRSGKLRKKDKMRPLVKMPESMGHWYISKDAKRNRPFKLPKQLSRKELTQKNLRRVTKGIKVYNRKGGGWTYIPYDGKPNDNDKRFRIPYAGLAKEAWARGFKKLGGKGSIPTLRRNRKAGKVYSSKRKTLYAELINKVSYVSKSSPAAARYGINRAKNKMRHIYAPKIEKKLQRDLRRK